MTLSKKQSKLVTKKITRTADKFAHVKKKYSEIMQEVSEKKIEGFEGGDQQKTDIIERINKKIFRIRKYMRVTYIFFIALPFLLFLSINGVVWNFNVLGISLSSLEKISEIILIASVTASAIHSLFQYEAEIFRFLRNAVVKQLYGNDLSVTFRKIYSLEEDIFEFREVESERYKLPLRAFFIFHGHEMVLFASVLVVMLIVFYMHVSIYVYIISNPNWNIYVSIMICTIFIVFEFALIISTLAINLWRAYFDEEKRSEFLEKPLGEQLDLAGLSDKFHTKKQK